MRNTGSKKPLSLEGGFRPGEVPGDWERWLARQTAEDGDPRWERLRRGLRLARQEELTPRQRRRAARSSRSRRRSASALY